MVVVPSQLNSNNSSPTDPTIPLVKNQIKDKSMSTLSSERSNLLMPNSTSSAISINNSMAPQTSAVPIYIGNLSNEVHESHLHGFVSDIGVPIISARICRNNETKKSLNYGYINFQSQEDADLAIKQLNYMPLLNRPVRMMPCQRDPTQRKLGKGNIVVKNLPMSVTHRLLYDTLTQIGTVQSIALKPDPSSQTTQNAFVQFDDESLANQAVELLNNSKIEGSTMLVAVFKPQKEQFEKQNMHEDTFVNCYVKNLPKHQFTTDEHLQKLFERFGEITSCKLAIDYNGQPTGAGFVCFRNHESAKLAVEEGSKIMFDHKTSSAVSGDDSNNATNETNDGPVQEKDDKETTISKDVEAESADALSQSKPLFVTRFQRKNERNQVLKDKFENLRISASSSSSGTANNLAASKYDASGNAVLDESRTISPEMNTINNVYIKNLHPSVTDKILHEEFSKFGTIISAKVMMQPNQISRGFGFVSFQTPKQAENAIAHMHGTYFYTKPLHCELAQKKAERLVNLRNQFRAYSNVASAYGNLPGLGIGHNGTYNGPSSAFNASALASHGHSVAGGPGNIQYFMKNPASAASFYAAASPNFMSYSHQPNYSPYYSHLHHQQQQQQRQQHGGHHMDPQSYFYSSNRFNSPSNPTQNMMHDSHNMTSSNPSGGSIQTNPIGSSASAISNSANSMANYQMQQSTGRMGASNANSASSQHPDNAHHNQHHNFKYNKSARNYNNSSVSGQNLATNQNNGSSSVPQNPFQLTSEEKEHYASILLNRLAKSPIAAHKKYAKMIASAVVEMKSNLAKEIVEYEDKKFYETSEKIYQHFINETR